MTTPHWQDPAISDLQHALADLQTQTARHQDALDLLAALHDLPGRHTTQIYRSRGTDGIIREVRAGDVRGILAAGRTVEVATTLTTDWHRLELPWAADSQVA